MEKGENITSKYDDIMHRYFMCVNISWSSILILCLLFSKWFLGNMNAVYVLYVCVC